MPALTAPIETTAPASTQPVTELLQAAGRGEQDAWKEILNRYGRLVSAVVRSHRLQEADARDAEQRTWLRLVENNQQVRDPERLGGWLSTTASRECLRIMRDRRPVAQLAEADAVPDPGCNVEERVVDRETAAQLWAIVDTLSPRRRRMVHALFADNPAPYADIARATGIPVGSLGPTRARVLVQLRRMLDEPASDRPRRLPGNRQRCGQVSG